LLHEITRFGPLSQAAVFAAKNNGLSYNKWHLEGVTW